jgi:hypothetical protein
MRFYFSFRVTFFGLKKPSVDLKKSAYVFLIGFLHLMVWGYRRKQAYSYKVCND